MDNLHRIKLNGSRHKSRQCILLIVMTVGSILGIVSVFTFWRGWREPVITVCAASTSGAIDFNWIDNRFDWRAHQSVQNCISRNDIMQRRRRVQARHHQLHRFQGLQVNDFTIKTNTQKLVRLRAVCLQSIIIISSGFSLCENRDYKCRFGFECITVV